MFKHYKIVIVRCVACLLLLVSTLATAALIKLNINNPNDYPLVFQPYNERGDSCVNQGANRVACTISTAAGTNAVDMYVELYWSKRQDASCIIDIGLKSASGSNSASFEPLISNYIYTLQPTQWDKKSNLTITMNITGLKQQNCK